ncbi:unnamed protein product [Hermetia illucens]|uniref:Cuticle protein CPCFC domain-containing protein n=1 Tax=Hermetia illucens TaxID=343691 RepID=A0A7R8YKR3_HERIL|nr:cdc42 effector protein 1-like [Hermetia illucens]CAD7076815.1 unnamed protein product [Hermetia illucens]
MFSKLAFVCLVAFAAAAPQHPPAAQFPAGVNPALCPGFPVCDNALLHNPQPHQSGHWGAPAPAWNNPAPSWNNPAPSWNNPAPAWNNPAPAGHWGAPAAPAWGAPALTGPAGNALPPADKFPAGVNPHSCPNYPFCDTAAAGHAPQVAPLPGWTERQYPAGVSPHTCPNFPYCS